MPPPPMHAGADAYVETGNVKSDFGFDSASIRAAFIRKVFVTPSLYFMSYAVFMVVYFTLMCCESVRRSFPGNLIALSILTLSVGYMTMMICSFHNVISVFLCLIITAVCCGGIILFSTQTKYDLTSMYGIMFILSLVLLVFGIVAIIAGAIFKTQLLYSVYAGLAALLFMVYLAMDIQAIMGGRKYQISPEDHIFAAIQVFLDIVYIFWMLLTLFGSNK
ncbi:unnamed protein product [Thelazia callipaeda]|uniref:Protein lifeguard 3 n=1 Tax=Thelazia callipaeda TaxID=103827 RepID=A0A0N5CRQ5_THECL|nr:unnamed protein product [Thelazia callipaeda]